jgi:hypothetical protein
MEKAVKAARAAFEHGPWRKMPASGRGRLIHRLAGRPPGPRQTPRSASWGSHEADLAGRRAGPGGPARTRGSALQSGSSTSVCEIHAKI